MHKLINFISKAKVNGMWCCLPMTSENVIEFADATADAMKYIATKVKNEAFIAMELSELISQFSQLDQELFVDSDSGPEETGDDYYIEETLSILIRINNKYDDIKISS